ncbi:SPFH domain-containing protein [Hypnocyclicus thermotrophus]|uniref:SPFH domain-containing protein n=1 Tax=Hypnocyclicus thermotrophus TaxID=1627895 RepID=A0AA46DZU7_9FUSO|nr:SPFH domain-containing protein [Hypnocyclicus thermotrophus]TDT71567.1 SPFH domain-containing protein [Hypnocyclicus thermotrophus]
MFFLSIILIIFLFIFVSSGIIIVKQAEVIVVERLGKYNKTLESGLNFIIPIIDTPRIITWRFVEQRGDQILIYTKGVKRIDLRESVYDFPKQRVITSDNVTIEINALLYFQITDPMKAVYEIANLPEAIEKLTQTTLRNVIGGLSLDQTLVSRDEINTKLRLILDEATDKWGVKVNRVELQDIIPPTEIRVAMEKQMKAERDKRASILEAEGAKRSQILEAEGYRDAAIAKAEGYKRSKILEAEGQAEARLKVIEAEKKALEKIKETVKDEQKSVEYLVALKYIEAFRNISENSNDKTVFMPYEATSVMSSLGGIKELFQKK